MKNKPTNITSLIKKRDINNAKEILEKEFELIDLSDNDPDYDSIYAKVRGGFFKTLKGNAHIKYPDGKYTVYGTDENGNDYFEILDEEDLGWFEDEE
tara:strand:- start:2058 stop:2348 length:291 start_codon:yes stop_codon:yes gene_type:complete